MKLELKANMYVRTKNRGIAKFRGWNAYDENKVAIHTHNEGDIEITPVIDKNTIIKASYNIIDLIEVGDYVNGIPVEDITRFKDGTWCITFDEWRWIDNNVNAIETIVTKEQFSKIEYRLGDK